MSHVVPFHLRNLHSASKAEAASLEWSQRHSNVSTLYPNRAVAADDEPKIPDPGLFATLINTAPGGADLPTPAECAVHLELLETFYKLRVDVIMHAYLDTAFGLEINKKTVYRRTYDIAKYQYVMKPTQLRDTTWPSRRRRKWLYFLGIAVNRFEIWVKKMDEFLKAQDRESVSGPSQECLTLPNLPPLDVLMVWHAYLLNPYDYDKACRRQNLSYVAKLRFPWKDVHAAISSRDWKYTLPGPSALWARDHARLEPDLFNYLCEAGKTHSPVNPALAWYGHQQGTRTPSLNERPNVQGLSERDSAFLNAMPRTRAEADAGKPLVENVQRQAMFIDKMHAQLWIRSPAAEGTLRRAVDRYDKFLRLFKLYPGKMLVPTLDIDIAWHTHQCSATVYAESVRQRAGRFVNHDDRLGRSVLNGGMEDTKTLFLTRFGEEYEKCLCWDCETMASVLEETDDDKMEGREEASILAERVRKDVEYYRCVEIARQHGRALPIRSP
ncbi:hypothetical protein S40288_06041 [Stachybotrys chartarum IBT 40288]|nr:hypothetical protein S40288_06041 [Stachybotrys chartarum IBT 40288]